MEFRLDAEVTLADKPPVAPCVHRILVGNKARSPSNFPRIVGPVEQRLSLLGAAGEVAGAAVFLNLGEMAANGPPAADLPLVVRTAAAQIVAAVPLKPAPRIIGVYPTLGPPHGQRLRGVDPKEIQIRIVPVRAELGLLKPILRKLFAAIGHVLPAKHAEPQHLLGCKLGTEFGMKVSARRRGQNVNVAPLHQVMHFDARKSRGMRSAAQRFTHTPIRYLSWSFPVLK